MHRFALQSTGPNPLRALGSESGMEDSDLERRAWLWIRLESTAQQIRDVPMQVRLHESAAPETGVVNEFVAAMKQSTGG
jgi:hypothetical protein